MVVFFCCCSRKKAAPPVMGPHCVTVILPVVGQHSRYLMKPS